VHTVTALRRLHVHVTERQYTLLAEEASRSGLSMATLVRRALDSTYRPAQRGSVKGYLVSFGAWRDPDPALVGRPKPSRRIRDD